MQSIGPLALDANGSLNPVPLASCKGFCIVPFGPVAADFPMSVEVDGEQDAIQRLRILGPDAFFFDPAFTARQLRILPPVMLNGYGDAPNWPGQQFQVFGFQTVNEYIEFRERNPLRRGGFRFWQDQGSLQGPFYGSPGQQGDFSAPLFGTNNQDPLTRRGGVVGVDVTGKKWAKLILFPNTEIAGVGIGALPTIARIGGSVNTHKFTGVGVVNFWLYDYASALWAQIQQLSFNVPAAQTPIVFPDVEIGADTGQLAVDFEGVVNAGGNTDWLPHLLVLG